MNDFQRSFRRSCRRDGLQNRGRGKLSRHYPKGQAREKDSVLELVAEERGNRIRTLGDRNLGADLDSKTFEADDFAGVIGEQTDPVEAQVGKNLGS